MAHSATAGGWTRFGAIVVGLAAVACSEEAKTNVPPGILAGDCDLITPEFCGLPFPSNVYLDDDPTGRNPSGKRIHFGATTLPPRVDNEHFPPELFFDLDGFSPGQAPFTHFPLVKCDDCAKASAIADSLKADHPTVLLEVPSGRRIPHWVDLDQATDHDGLEGRPDERLIMIRPAERLRESMRYIVAMRGLKNTGGALVQPSPVFRALRDGTAFPGDDAVAKATVQRRHDLYEDVFGQLAKAGVQRGSLQIAWDYSTGSTQSITGRMVEMRDKALAAVGDDGPTFRVDRVEESPNEHLLRRIHLVMTVPLYLTGATKTYVRNKLLDRFNLDASGALVQNGTMDWNVLVLVPKSVLTAGPKHGLVQNGHGLFGSRFEGQGGYFAIGANRTRYVGFAVNLFGFDSDSVPMATDGLMGRFENLKSFAERQVQGTVNQLLAMRMMIGRVARDGIKDSEGNFLLDPAWVDRDVRAYRGDSQGGIMGTTYMSVSTDVTRGLLGEPGAPYNLLLNRSSDFGEYQAIIESAFGGRGRALAPAIQLVLGAMQLFWDHSEPDGYVSHMTTDLLPGTPAHHVLLHVARGDHQVTTFGAHVIGRAIGAVLLASDDPDRRVWQDVYGLENVQAPLTGRSALVEFDFGLAPNPEYNTGNLDGCDPHDRVRILGPSYDQQDVFFRTGNIVWKCNGACNCNDAVDGDPKEEEGCDPAPNRNDCD